MVGTTIDIPVRDRERMLRTARTDHVVNHNILTAIGISGAPVARGSQGIVGGPGA